MIKIVDDTTVDCAIAGPSSQLLLWLSGRASWADAGLAATGPRAELAADFTDLFTRF